MNDCQVSYPVDIAVFVATHALQDGTIQAKLQTCFIQHLPFVGVPSDQTVDLDSLRLANTMTPCLSLIEEFTKGSKEHHIKLLR